MTDQPENADLDWRDGVVPVATRFDDPYYSIQNGLAETEHVFLAGNRLPERFFRGFHICELGFGTGLNLLSAWRAWEASGQTGQLRFTSFEAYPMTPADMARAHQQWPELARFSQRFFTGWDSRCFRFEAETLSARVIIGDARQTLPEWQGQADAWFLDGFSPAKNPELWEEGLMCGVAACTRPAGTFATYSAAGHVRQSLAKAGFEVTRVPGYGRKRHMSVGTLKPD
ncbi:MAG: tRNA (5-methylaminomethyl-2-thiouridine)(34)-methyltransferase MnmD [Rhodobacteraceae bacterium]|nr:tRNA (5-methylaminomethyl-2-thiouridine)(34)-methyltransferase MnmD [Paracoccaceae bacterium]